MRAVAVVIPEPKDRTRVQLLREADLPIERFSVSLKALFASLFAEPGDIVGQMKAQNLNWP